MITAEEHLSRIRKAIADAVQDGYTVTWNPDADSTDLVEENTNWNLGTWADTIEVNKFLDRPIR